MLTFEVESDPDAVGAGADPRTVQDGLRRRHWCQHQLLHLVPQSTTSAVQQQVQMKLNWSDSEAEVKNPESSSPSARAELSRTSVCTGGSRRCCPRLHIWFAGSTRYPEVKEMRPPWNGVGRRGKEKDIQGGGCQRIIHLLHCYFILFNQRNVVLHGFFIYLIEMLLTEIHYCRPCIHHCIRIWYTLYTNHQTLKTIIMHFSVVKQTSSSFCCVSWMDRRPIGVLATRM